MLSPLTVEEATERFKEWVPKRTILQDLFPPLFFSNKPYAGLISENSFTIINGYRNLPGGIIYVEGEIKSGAKGLIIHLEFWINPVLYFAGFILTSVVLMDLGFTIHYQIVARKFDTQIFGFPGFALIIYIILMIMYNYQTNKAKAYLQSVFEADETAIP